MTDTLPNLDESVARYAIEERENWRQRHAPAVHFPSSWPIEIIMPFGKAVARFRVVNDHGVKVSVYFDDCDALGYVNSPYWEIYPIGGSLTVADEDDTQRFLAGDEEAMIAAIAQLGDPVRGAAVGLGMTNEEYDEKEQAHGGAQRLTDV